MCNRTIGLRASTVTHLEAPDVMRGIPESRDGERQSAAQCLGHGFPCRLAVTPPVHGKAAQKISLAPCGLGKKSSPLATHSRRTGENDRFACAKSLSEQIEHHFVVDYRIRVVHLHWVGPIVEHDGCMRNAFAEVSLSARKSISRQQIKPQLTLKQSTPKSRRAVSFAQYHSRAAGFVTSTMASPGCHKSHLKKSHQEFPSIYNILTYCQTVPSFRLMKYPPLAPSLNIGDNCEI